MNIKWSVRTNFRMRRGFKSEHVFLVKGSRYTIRANPPSHVEFEEEADLSVNGGVLEAKNNGRALDWMQQAMDAIRKEAVRVR